MIDEGEEESVLPSTEEWFYKKRELPLKYFNRSKETGKGVHDSWQERIKGQTMDRAY